MSYVAAVCGKGEQVNSVKEQLLQSNPVLEGEDSGLCLLCPRIPSPRAPETLSPTPSYPVLVHPEKSGIGMMAGRPSSFPFSRGPLLPSVTSPPLSPSLQLLAMPRPFATTTPLDL